MSAMRTVSRWLLWISVALLASPGLAAAQNAVLYEVTETMKLTGKNGGRRDARASLMGTVAAGSSLCPKELGVPRCSVVAEGNSKVDLGTGKGSLDGKFAVVLQDKNPVDGDEFVIARGRFTAVIDLSPAVLHNWPLGALERGTWSAKGEKGGPLRGLKMEGTVSGIFRLPFIFGLPSGCLDDGNPSDCWVFIPEPVYWVAQPAVSSPVPSCLLDYDPSDCVSFVARSEHSLDVPTVRLDLWFTETYLGQSRGNRDGDDD